MLRRVLLFGILTTLSLGCDKKKDSSSGSSTNVTSIVTMNLQQVQTGFTPDSIAVSSSSTMNSNSKMGIDLKSVTAQANLCANISFFECQSILVKLYFAIGKSMVGTTAQLVANIGSQVGQLTDGATGTVTSTDGSSISYSKTDATVGSAAFGNSSWTDPITLGSTTITLPTSLTQ
jgi:hypothetical protein